MTCGSPQSAIASQSSNTIAQLYTFQMFLPGIREILFENQSITERIKLYLLGFDVGRARTKSIAIV